MKTKGQSKTRRVFTQDRQEHSRVRRAILDSGETIMTGSTGASFYVPSIRTKYIPIYQCIEWQGEKFLPGEVARAELDKHFVDIKKIKNWRGDHIKLLRLRWPMFFDQPYEGEVFYFDLVGAYWQFYKNLWIDLGYPCGYGTLDLAPVSEALKDQKRARNAVIGITRSTSVSMQKGFKVRKVATKNRYLSPPIWANLMGWLQEIASEALRRGAVYAMMDGYFFPSTSDAIGFEQFLQDWGLLYHKRMGQAKITGWGAYSTDWGRETHLFRTGARGRVNSVCLQFSDPYKFLTWWRNSINYRLWRYENGKARLAKRMAIAPTCTI